MFAKTAAPEAAPGTAGRSPTQAGAAAAKGRGSPGTAKGSAGCPEPVAVPQHPAGWGAGALQGRRVPRGGRGGGPVGVLPGGRVLPRGREVLPPRGRESLHHPQQRYRSQPAALRPQLVHGGMATSRGGFTAAWGAPGGPSPALPDPGAVEENRLLPPPHPCPAPRPAAPRQDGAGWPHTAPADASAAQQCTPGTARGEGQRGRRGRRCATGAVPTTASAEPARSAAPWAASSSAPRRCQVQAGPARCPARGLVSPGPPSLRLPRSPAHPGVCPRFPAGPRRVRCPNACSDDRGCPPEQKCCFTGCSLGCVTPLGSGSSDFPPPGEVDWSLSQAEETHRGDKGGVLGVPPRAAWAAQSPCRWGLPHGGDPAPSPQQSGVEEAAASWCCPDSPCPAAGEPQKPGTCPQDFTHCLRLEPSLCTNDSVCPGWHKCCPHGCRLRCTPPAEGTSPAQPPASCC
ncbi:Balbiani ring protein 3 isoform X3 [Aix galericulata]|nr:Balbiani ring protein 3 isoform X3 [Aix galericulata]